MVTPKLSNLNESINLEVNNGDSSQGKEILEDTGEYCVPDIRDNKEKNNKKMKAYPILFCSVMICSGPQLQS